MPQAVWSGAISFGLVSVPVRLYRATREEDVRFHELRSSTGERIRHRRVGEVTGEEVDWSDIVKGYEVEPGRWVTFTRDELEELSPRQTHTIEITSFVDLDEIDPLLFDTSYYVGPGRGSEVGKPYVLLREALARTGKVGIGRYVLRTREHLCAVRPGPGGTLLCATLWFHDEVRAPEEVVDPEDLVAVEITGTERRMADTLVEALTEPWDPTAHENTHRRDILATIEARARGEDVVPSPEEPPDNVVDITSALEASVAAARSRTATGGARSDGADSPADRPLASLTRDELYELARTHDIEGRSAMTKDELVAALARAS